MSQGKRSQRGPSRLALLLTWASTTSALSLANFQLITSGSVPAPCIVAYNSQIPNCATRDFTGGNQCSTACVNGLVTIQQSVIAICGGLLVNPNTVLGVALQGKLVSALCPGVNNPTPTTTVVVTRTTARVTTTPTNRGQTTEPARSVSSRPPPEDAETRTSAADDTTSVEPPVSTSQPGRITTATTQTTTTQVDAASTSLSPGRGPAAGVGSPFDPVQLATGNSQFQYSRGALLVAAGVAMVLLR